jgi:hypothetical protein
MQVTAERLPLWSSGQKEFLTTDPDVLCSIPSAGTGSTQPREDNYGDI